ncbi:hypothetical protein CBS63078_476 [Aspergillus niger]|nr:hypothetical protein CBS115989_3998 [Aspergillus niger]KAI2833319.1 hypothetical protein CBS133816_684 [Aspergillus niger]KAI2856455.1 hypothetical protein CBS11232_3806 [Aspergillus niger]KAI2862453.1 hypothetical protein CBS12448_4424 [Aspergillus niger]KAI2876928.1 hypothetical protein CBS115988_4205 [Aspergillus niger]
MVCIKEVVSMEQSSSISARSIDGVKEIGDAPWIIGPAAAAVSAQNSDANVTHPELSPAPPTSSPSNITN